MTTNSAVKWAETDLRLHTEYDELTALLDEAEKVRTHHIQLSNSLRILRHETENREMEIAQSVRAQGEFPSAAAFERKVRETFAVDQDYQRLRVDVLERANDVDAIGGQLRGLELRIKAKTARVEQTGHLLKYYAEFKSAQTEARRQASNPVERWPN